MLQLEKAEKLDTDEEDYRRIIYSKTTSLFEASIVSSAFSVNASESEVESVRSYARHIGRSFQMMDDILDYSPELSTGKPTGQDIVEKKITLPLLGLFAKAPRSIVHEIKRRMKAPDATLAADAIALVREYGGIDYARERLDAEVEGAIEALSPIPQSKAKDYLKQLARQMAVRTS